MLRFSRWQIGLQEVPLRDSITEVKGLLNLLELFYQEPLAGMICVLNVPLVSTVPCIRNLWNTIHRFPEDKFRKGRMDCMRRWRIQGTVQSHPHDICALYPPFYSSMEMAEEEGDLEVRVILTIH